MFIVIIVFEIVINMYRLLSITTSVNKKITNVVLWAYNVALYCSGVLFMLEKLAIASYFVLAVVVVGAVCVIYLSISFVSAEEDGGEDLKQEKCGNGVVIDNSILSDEIVE